MFHIDATFEDCRIQADAQNEGRVGTDWQVKVSDNHTGESRVIFLTPAELSMVLAISLDPNGEPEGFEKFYEVLEPIFKYWPNNLRPIP